MEGSRTDAEGGIGVLGALSIGIGGIVGGGFFATFGMAVVDARGSTWLSFLVGGVLALLTAYAYLRLTLRYPGPEGTVGFIRQGFGEGLVPSTVSVLLVLSYVGVMAVYARSLGAYASSYLPPEGRGVGTRAIASAAIVLLALVNVGGAALMARFEGVFNAGKLAALAVFIVAGLSLGNPAWERLGPSSWQSPGTIVASGMVVFLAYEGFELISNASARIRDPERTLPIAYFGSILAALVIYVLAIVVAVGHMPFEAMAEARDFALSAASGRILGPAGFAMMTAGAVLASASAVNADLFGAEKLPPRLAVGGAMPEVLGDEIRGKPLVALATIAALALVAVNLLELNPLSAATSGGFLLVFAAVNVANARLARETGSRGWISAVAGAATLGALAVMVAQALGSRGTRSSAWAVLGIVALSAGIAGATRLGRKARFG